jgi:hypothetical protein
MTYTHKFGPSPGVSGLIRGSAKKATCGAALFDITIVDRAIFDWDFNYYLLFTNFLLPIIPLLFLNTITYNPGV